MSQLSNIDYVSLPLSQDSPFLFKVYAYVWELENVGIEHQKGLFQQFELSGLQQTFPDFHQVLNICAKPEQSINSADWVIRPDSFDLIVWQESMQSVDPVSLFNHMLESLKPTGSLVILNEFLISADSHSAHLPSLNNTLALAQRFGFKCVEQQNLSAGVIPVLDGLLRMSQKHQKQLKRDLLLSTVQFDSLEMLNRDYKAHYTQGQYRYVLLSFRRGQSPKWRLKLFNQQDFDAVQVLFQSAFHERLSLDFWRWKYASEHAHQLCIWQGNTLVAHYGGIPRDILYFGQCKTAVQIGDVMVHPSQRGVLTKTGPFFRMAATFLERYIGFGQPFLLGFGFPNARAMKVAEHLGLYEEVGQMVEISWQLSDRSEKALSCLRCLNQKNIKAYSSVIDEIWQLMAVDLQTALVGVRDAPYLLKRYLNHPQQRYHIFLVQNRLTQKAYGVVVLSINQQRGEIIDIISSLKHIPLLVFHAQRFARLSGCEQLFCQVTDNFSAHFKTKDSNEKILDIRIPSNCWTSGPSSKMIKGQWWLMAGDMDFR